MFLWIINQFNADYLYMQKTSLIIVVQLDRFFKQISN